MSFSNGGLPLDSKVTEEWSEEVMLRDHCGVLQRLNCMLLLLNFSGWRDARRENSRKTSTQGMSPATGDTSVKEGLTVPLQVTEETAVTYLLLFAHL